eukprot:224343-Chlamydomonas_euryale.AAC.1
MLLDDAAFATLPPRRQAATVARADEQACWALLQVWLVWGGCGNARREGERGVRGEGDET